MTAIATPSILTVLLSGAFTAVRIAVGAGIVAFGLGLLLALVNVFTRFGPLRVAIGCYVEWMRNVPALAHLFVLYFGLASVGIQLSPLCAAIIGLGLVGAGLLLLAIAVLYVRRQEPDPTAL